MEPHPVHTNRLIHEKSPYLLQHAHNPVDWYPWGEEAFELARRLDRPLFLSIGYATCHWCHVMERESFQNVEIARMMNDTFVNVKIDREELPDVDSVYMEFAQGMLSGAAGWPLNVVATPDLLPFFAATYLPPHSSPGLMGLADLIQKMKALWEGEDREQIEAQAEAIVQAFSDTRPVSGQQMPAQEIVEETAEQLFHMADPAHGGMKGSPKFPMGYHYSFLLQCYHTSKDARAIFLVERTLQMVRRGGIYDQLGGGIARYSVDDQWHIPHFEKMLYDHALLAESYLDGWKLTKQPFYRSVCEELLDYVLREMTAPEGGFYAAQDADTNEVEGYYYTWTHEEITELLGAEAELFCEYYHVTRTGNFRGRNVLYCTLSLEEFAAKHQKNLAELEQALKKQRQILLDVRSKRTAPQKDDKILTGWNGLMIHALVEAGESLRELRYVQAAFKGARFIRDHLWKQGQLMRRWREGEAMYRAGLDEHAAMIRACLSLFEAGTGAIWLGWAIEMTHLLQKNYKEAGGAFYQNDGTDPNLIIRRCQLADGSEPSGNAIHTENLLRLHQITQDASYLEQAEDVLKAVEEPLEQYPPGHCFHAMNLGRYYSKHSMMIVVALNQSGDWREEIQNALAEKFLPYRCLIWHTGDFELLDLLPHLREKPPVDGKTTLYICEKGRCTAPVSSLAEILETIAHLA